MADDDSDVDDYYDEDKSNDNYLDDGVYEDGHSHA